MYDLLASALASGDDPGVALSAAVAIVCAVVMTVLYLRLLRWVFSLFGAGV